MKASAGFAQDTYHVHLPQFEGPFDLLLFFIQRDELDIRDIPIARITNDFLAYIHQAKQMQINLAADFIVVASQLMKIKARMLLPRPKVDEEGRVEDPRQELVDRLLEFQRYKDAMRCLAELEAEQLQRQKRGYAAKEAELLKGEAEPADNLHGLTLYGLLKVYKKVLEQHAAEAQKPRHVIQAYPYRMEDIRAQVQSQVRAAKQLSFADLVLERPERIYLVFCFLTILELVNQHKIMVVIGDGFNNFWLKPCASPEAELPLEPADAPTVEEYGLVQAIEDATPEAGS